MNTRLSWKEKMQNNIVVTDIVLRVHSNNTSYKIVTTWNKQNNLALELLEDPAFTIYFEQTSSMGKDMQIRKCETK